MSTRLPTVFISSTRADLGSYRAAAQDAARKAGFEPIVIEGFEAEARPPVKVDLDRVATADVLVVIVAHRYGWIPNPDDSRASRGWNASAQWRAAYRSWHFRSTSITRGRLISSKCAGIAQLQGVAH